MRGLCLFLAMTIGGAAMAATPARLLGSFQSWDAYSAGDGPVRNCYALSSPTQFDRPGAVQRAQAYFLIRWQGEPSVIEGAGFQPGSQAKILIGDQHFTMFTEGDGGWVRDPNEERRLVAALKGGTAMVVQGQVGPQGVMVVDHYSLRGLSAALTKAEQACK